MMRACDFAFAARRYVGSAYREMPSVPREMLLTRKTQSTFAICRRPLIDIPRPVPTDAQQPAVCVRTLQRRRTERELRDRQRVTLEGHADWLPRLGAVDADEGVLGSGCLARRSNNR